MERGASFGIVHGVAGEHARNPRGHLRLVGELAQEPHRFRVDPVLGVVEQQPARLEGESLGARGVSREQLA